MNDRDIKKMLSDGAKDVLPDRRIKDKIKSELGGEEERVLVLAGGGTAASGRRRNIIIAACAAALALIIALCFLLPPLFGKDDPFGGGLTGGNKFEDITDANSFYAYGAASVGTMLTARADGGSAAAFSAVTLADDEGRGGRDEQIESINRYMSLVESLLSDSAIVGSAIDGADGYDYGMKISYKDLLGGTVSYEMYYNKIFIEGETDGEEAEEDYSIEGMLVVGGVTYPVDGTYETETSEGETGDKLEFRAYTSADRRSYIEVRQEYENETDDGETETDKEYVYAVVVDGNVTEKTEVKYEKEGEEVELELVVETGGVKDELKFRTRSENGESVIVAEGKIDDADVRFRVRVSAGQYRYEFEDGTSSDYDRYEEDDDDGGRHGRSLDVVSI